MGYLAFFFSLSYSFRYILTLGITHHHNPLYSRSSRLLGVQVRPVRARGGGAAVPVAARQREPRLPRQDQEGEEHAAQGDLPPRGHRQHVLQTRRTLQTRVNIANKKTN